MADVAGVVLKDAPGVVPVKQQEKQPERESKMGVARVAPDPSRPRAIVVRRMTSDQIYEPGEVIEVPGRRRDVLIRGRMMREFTYGEQIYRCTCGRMWVDEERAKNHGCNK